MTKQNPPGRLVLEDGTVLHGNSFGAEGASIGELVFNTSMTGYQEILTDPSYRGQVVMLTYPLIGNYGICPEDDESSKCWLDGLIVREASRMHSNFRAGRDLPGYLRDQGVVAIDGVDTRYLTKKIRSSGEMKVLLTSDTSASDAELIERVRSAPGLAGRDLVQDVSRKEQAHWTQGYESEFSPEPETKAKQPPIPIVAIDCGIKRNILRSLIESGFDVNVVPAHASCDEIRALTPRGLFLSNGPGDPAAIPYVVDTVRRLALDDGLPTFGICLGHQILSQVLGGRTYKMPFGHHGGNQPVKDLRTGKIEITAQNHSFAVDEDSLPDDVEITHRNLNDGTVEGLAHRHRPIWSVQYHPEAAPGPHDSLGLFARFRGMFA